MKRITLCALLMTLFLLLSCGSGSAKAENSKTTFLTSIANLGKGFLDVFTSLSDMITGAFGVKAETKKSEVGAYFTKIADTMTSVKAKLNDVVATNGNYPKLKTVVEHFITNTLDKIAEGAKTAATGTAGDDKIGSAPKEGQDAVTADTTSVNALVKAIKTIVDVVLKDGEGNEKSDKTIDSDKKKIGQLFAKKDDGAQDTEESKASASIGAVTGADILQAIAVAKRDDNKKEIKENQKDAIIAGGIALRAMAKGGKFAAKQDASDKYANAVNGVAANAVGKTLSPLIIAIRNTVDNGLKSISEALAAVKQEDKSAEATPADATASGQQ
ncbi:variable large family protein [Borrelia venezuelensis]|uniref:variable large family protein n=1 Tax=Borrelia venezuelensis TaxID=1653839 RepID=UPI003D9BE863